jgi:hypothetical protein
MSLYSIMVKGLADSHLPHECEGMDIIASGKQEQRQ